MRTIRWTLFALLLAAAPANADGPPALGSIGAPQIGSAVRYTIRPGRSDTVLVRHGRPTTTLRLQGQFVIPVVAFDQSAAGLSSDGRTLVLSRLRLAFPQRTSRLVIIDARTLRPRRYVSLVGDFSFDAISPHGRWIYLIQYLTPGNGPFSYRVRALDGLSGVLLRRAVVDPRDRGEQMQGFPVTRITSPDGRWAYTLYAGGDAPFVHALDTERLRARCIDLPRHTMLNGDPSAIRLVLSRNELLVKDGRRTVANISVGPHKHDVVRAELPLIAVVALGLGGALLMLTRRRARRRLHYDPSPSPPRSAT